MSKDTDRRPSDKKEERDHLAKVVYLAPLVTVILQLLDLILKLFGVIR
jgi:hypothetical protein